MTRPTVLAYYFPNWHDDPQNSTRYGQGWNEWELLKNAKPRFDGHWQPRIPAAGYVDEADPAVMEDEIDLAADHGIDAFAFDFYWYEDGPFLSNALDQGYLQSGNRSRVQFALMWANHDWLNIFPARHHENDHLKRGAVNRATFDTMVDHVIDAYFSQPEYLRVDGRPFFSIYEIGSLVEGLGGVEAARDALRSFEEKTIAAGHPGLYLDAVVWGFGVLPTAVTLRDPQALIDALGFVSASSYVWIHHTDVESHRFPLGDWDRVANDAFTEYAGYIRDLTVPFIPNVSVGWDASPRTDQDQPFTADQYPWYPVFNSDPSQFRQGLQRAKELLAGQDLQHPMLTLNAWNEWTEGSAILPDQRFGTGYLDAVREVFGRAAGPTTVAAGLETTPGES